MKKDYVYELVTADKYEMVLALAETMEDLANLVKINRKTLVSALSSRSLIAGQYRVVKVNTKNFEFNFEDYLDFCSTGDLNPKSAKSLQRFKEYCGEAYEF